MRPGADPLRIRTIGICVDFYIDKFGVFRTTHRSAGGMYLTIHNQEYQGRDQPRNHFVLGFTPNGAETQDGMMPIMRSLKRLAAEGFKTTFNDGKEVLVKVKLLSVSADMQEANSLAGCKGPTSISPCRFCELPRCDFNVVSLARDEATKRECHRQIHTTENYRDGIIEHNGPGRPPSLSAIFRCKGLRDSMSVIEEHGPSFNPFIQVYPGLEILWL